MSKNVSGVDKRPSPPVLTPQPPRKPTQQTPLLPQQGSSRDMNITQQPLATTPQPNVATAHALHPAHRHEGHIERFFHNSLVRNACIQGCKVGLSDLGWLLGWSFVIVGFVDLHTGTRSLLNPDGEVHRAKAFLMLFLGGYVFPAIGKAAGKQVGSFVGGVCENGSACCGRIADDVNV